MGFEAVASAVGLPARIVAIAQTRKHLGRHPGRAAKAARPGTQVPRHHEVGMAGVHGSRLSRLTALGRDDNGGNCASSYAIALRGARAETRTRTVEGLSLAPLPLGYTGEKKWCATGDSNSDWMRSERIASAVGLVAPRELVLSGGFDPPASALPTRCSAE